VRLVSIKNCMNGMTIARPVFDEQGRLLLGSGVSLTKRILERLESQGITHLYIDDELTKDLVLEDNISIEVRTEATKSIQTVFEAIREGKHKSKATTYGKMVNEFKRVFENLLSELKRNQQLMNLLSYIHVKDNYVFTHSLNVTLYSLAIAMQLKFDDKKLHELGLGALLHDIGKMMIPEEILHKPGKLTDEEYAIMKKHTEYGFELLRKEPELSVLVAHCAYQHHEKLDGSGYPRGLKDKDIHPYAKIIAVADVFDALTTHQRAYRKGMLPHEAMEILYAGSSNTQFDQKVVEAFRSSIALYPIGVTVTLNTGEKAVVVGYNTDTPQRPKIRIFTNTQGEMLKEWIEIDLSVPKYLSTMIIECDAII
jgi:putative nucleotidyltransferase with HDIG domain